MPEGEAVRDNLDAPNWHIDIHEQVELHAPNSRKRRKQKSAKERIGEYGKFVPCGRDDENMGGERPSLGQQQRAKRSQVGAARVVPGSCSCSCRATTLARAKPQEVFQSLNANGAERAQTSALASTWHGPLDGFAQTL